MNPAKYAATLCLCFICVLNASAKSITFSCAGKVIALLDSTEASIISQKPDAYTNEHTSFEIFQ